MNLFPNASGHLLISLLGWLIGVAIGGSVGYGCALLLNTIFSSYPKLHKPSAILPWQTVMIGVLLIIFSPALTRIFGLGVTSGILAVGLTILLLALPFTVIALLEYWHPTILGVRLFAGARTLLIASVAFTTGIGLFGGGGLGFSAIQSIQHQDYDAALKVWFFTVGLMLMLDLLLGGLQLVTSNKLGAKFRHEVVR